MEAAPGHTQTHTTHGGLFPPPPAAGRGGGGGSRGDEGGTAHTQHTTRSEEERRLRFHPPFFFSLLPPVFFLPVPAVTCQAPNLSSFLCVCCLSEIHLEKRRCVVYIRFLPEVFALCMQTGLSFLPSPPRFFFCFYCPLVSQGGAPTNSGVLKSSFLRGGVDDGQCHGLSGRVAAASGSS